MKKVLYCLILVMVSFSLVGCKRTDLINTKNLQTLDSMEDKSLSFSKELEGINLITEYKAGDYDIGNWLITDSKALNMSLSVQSMPDGTEVFVEHVHADISLASRDAQLNGMPQDSMDDSYHASGQDGFYLSTQYPYQEIFAIEGYSQTLINGWEWYNGSYGRGSISEKRLTERNLVHEGLTFGNKVQVIYNLNIRHEGERYFHTNVIKDEFYIKTTYVSTNNRE